jgi:RsiW-degrading membrane proteinase PrsW (M82 family)
MRTLIIIILSFTGIIFLLNYTIDNPNFKLPKEQISFYIKTDNLNKAEDFYKKELEKNRHDLDLNYGYVKNHFNLPAKTKVGKRKYIYRDDETILNYYKSLTFSNDSVTRDIGFYFSGLCHFSKNNDSIALIHFKRVKNRNLKYLNNTLGEFYQRKILFLAIIFFEKEIKNNGNLTEAVYNLSKIYISLKDTEKFEKLLNNSHVKPYVSLGLQREFHYLQNDYPSYLKTVWQKIVKSIDNYGFMGALFIALIWLLYLRFLDIYEREKWYNIAIVFLLSCLLTYSCYLLYDFFNVSLHFDLNGNILNDLAYCTFGIGLIEEITKLLPFIIFLSFSKAVNEPIDYVIYASVSAIGFSFMENIQYFQNDKYYIMHGRALASVVGHMCFSSIVAYGFIVSKYKSKFPLIISVLICLFIASAYHGLYDFWLLNNSVKDFSILTIAVLVSSVLVWNSIKNNALNNSNFYNASIKFDNHRIFKYLFIALVGVFALEYIIVVFSYGPSAGNRLLLKSLLSGSFLFLFITGRLAQFEIKPGVWGKVKIWERKNN